VHAAAKLGLSVKIAVMQIEDHIDHDLEGRGARPSPCTVEELLEYLDSDPGPEVWVETE